MSEGPAAEENPDVIVPKGRMSGVGLVVAVAVIIAAGLVALGFYVYDAKDQPKPPTDEQQAAGETLDRSSPLDGATLGEEEKRVDQTIQDLDNNSDFNDEDLSDESLGI